MREEDHAFGRRSVIEIRSVQDEDFKKYNCSVDNGYGVDAAVISFTRKGNILIFRNVKTYSYLSSSWLPARKDWVKLAQYTTACKNTVHLQKNQSFTNCICC